MTKFKLIAYEKENGEVPVEEFLDSINPKMRAKIFGLLGILQEKGNMLREPYSKHIGDGIFELSCKFGSDITRVLAGKSELDSSKWSWEKNKRITQ